jgi:hypothetical protein
MNRGFYSLPDPREVGLKWKPYEQAREKITRVEKRHREAQETEANLNKRIREEQHEDVRQLARSILAGEDDPAAPTQELEGLAEKLREQRRQAEALAQALPVAEEELRQVVYEHQQRWKAEADSALEKAIAEERRAYDKALQLIQEPRAKRIYAEQLAAWVRYPQPTFSEPSDVAALSAMQNLGQGPMLAEQKLRERQHNEQLQAQQEGDVA